MESHRPYALLKRTVPAEGSKGKRDAAFSGKTRESCIAQLEARLRECGLGWRVLCVVGAV